MRPGRRDFRRSVVVMTDGIQEEDPPRPIVLADQLRAAGVAVFVIGLGADVDVRYLERLAAGWDALYLSPTAADLAGIYQEIARVIPCPVNAFWGGR